MQILLLAVLSIFLWACDKGAATSPVDNEEAHVHSSASRRHIFENEAVDLSSSSEDSSPIEIIFTPEPTGNSDTKPNRNQDSGLSVESFSSSSEAPAATSSSDKVTVSSSSDKKTVSSSSEEEKITSSSIDEPISFPEPMARWSLSDLASEDSASSIGNYSLTVGEGTIRIDSTEGLPIFDGTFGLSISNSAFQLDYFGVSARFKPTKFGRFNNIIVCEPTGGTQPGWGIRLEQGNAVFMIRTASELKWTYYMLGRVQVNQWSEIKVSRTEEVLTIELNGDKVISHDHKGSMKNMQTKIGIGYDAVQQNIHDRYFNGFIDQISIYAL